MASKGLTNWQAAREAVALGASLRDAAEAYGVTLAAIKKRAEREQWSRPEKIAALATVSPVVVAAQTWQQKGEAHRTQVFAMASRALAAIADTPPDLTNWSDIERAARLADRAAGLDTAQPVVSLTFPQAQSSEAAQCYVDIQPITDRHPPP
jgi:hypothetical protein